MNELQTDSHNGLEILGYIMSLVLVYSGASKNWGAACWDSGALGTRKHLFAGTEKRKVLLKEVFVE